MAAITAPKDHEEFFVCTGSYKIGPEDLAAFKNGSKKVVEYTRAASGNLFFTMAEDISEPGVLRIAEGWTSKDALQAHLGTQGFKDLAAESMKLNVLDRTMYVTKAKGWVAPLE